MTSGIGFSAEPKLISDRQINIPIQVFKKNLRGIVVVSADIDQKGAVEKCEIEKGLWPPLDTIIYSTILHSVFSPAYEAGKEVPATVKLEFVINPDSLIENSNDAVPDMEGVVLDQETNLPVGGAIANLEFGDSVADSDLAMPLSRYLEIIGKAPGQTCQNGMIVAKSDSLGRFAFRFLPSCPAIMTILAQRYDPARFPGFTQGKLNRKVKCYLTKNSPAKALQDTANQVVVYGYRAAPEKINIEEKQTSTGLTHYLSSILLSQATINNMPEARSALLVRGGSPFENKYIISGVPFLSPFHFGGISYADIDGLMISALSDVDVIVNRLAGRNLDVSGVMVNADPGIYRPADQKLIKRPELAIDYSPLSQDVLLSIPKRKSDDCLQIGFNMGDKYLLEWLSGSAMVFGSPLYGLGQPVNFGNVTMTGTVVNKLLKFDSFAWFAWDEYGAPDKIVPWGMASVKISQINQKVPEICLGGSSQYYAAGKNVGKNAFLNTTYWTTGTASMNVDTLYNKNNLSVLLDYRAEYLNWYGSIVQRYGGGLDTSYSSQNKELELLAHGFIEKQRGNFNLSADVLCSGLLYGTKPDLIVDPGFSFQWIAKHFLAEIHFGRITGRPDIRGLPDSSYRREQFHTYLASLPIFINSGPGIKFSLQPYIRKTDREPQMDPLLFAWNPALATPLLAEGIDASADLQFFKWVSLRSVCNLSQAQRATNTGSSIYEWNIPLSLKNGLHFNFGNFDEYHLFVNYSFSRGLPYFDFNESKYLRLPDYHGLDFSLQYRNGIIHNRYLTRFDAYFNVLNPLDFINVRDYYWDPSMQKDALTLGFSKMEAGLRLGFRL
ncbi:MAG: hypothetical protein PHC61_03065 [Chitinivibrionales bacterium]|nr:hypothetical protein [Chitinivibrionales bacterium]